MSGDAILACTSPPCICASLRSAQRRRAVFFTTLIVVSRLSLDIAGHKLFHLAVLQVTTRLVYS